MKESVVKLYGDAEIFQAIDSNDLAIVDLLLDSKVDVNLKENFDYKISNNEYAIGLPETLLLRAIHLNKPPFVETLLNHKADPNMCYSTSGNSPMNSAIIYEVRTEIVDYLYKNGANLSQKNNQGIDSFCLSVKKAAENKQEYLLTLISGIITYEKPEDFAGFCNHQLNLSTTTLYTIYTDNLWYCETPLLKSIHMNKTSVVKALLDLNVDPNICYKTSGNSPLNTAIIYKSDPQIVKYLCNSPNINVNLPNLQGQTPLLLAIQNKDLSSFKDLVKKKADPSIKDKTGANPKEIVKKAYNYLKDLSEQTGTFYQLKNKESANELFKLGEGMRQLFTEKQELLFEAIELSGKYDDITEIYNN